MIAVSLATMEESRALAGVLADQLAPGDVLELRGEIGAGKTTLVSLLMEHLGAGEPARSPTYTVAHEYELPDGRSLAHIDLYRHAGTVDEAAWGDLEPAFDATFVAVEWPDPLRAWYAGRPTWHLELQVVSQQRRVALVAAPDASRARACANALTRAR